MRKLSAMTIAVVSMCGLAACGETVNIGDNGVGPGITVQATGTADVRPDSVRLSITVSVLAEANDAALSTAADTAAVVREVLLEQEIQESDIATQTLSVNPEYSYTETEGQKIVGYRASQVFDVLVRDGTNAGDVVNEVVTKGGANVTINSVIPVIDDATDGAIAAREDAVKKARAKAEAYADLLGVELGKVVYLSEVSSPTNIVVGAKADAMAEGSAPVIDLGTQQVTVTVEVRWRLA